MEEDDLAYIHHDKNSHLLPKGVFVERCAPCIVANSAKFCLVHDVVSISVGGLRSGCVNFCKTGRGDSLFAAGTRMAFGENQPVPIALFHI
eukprot:scaffold1027_cov108-Cylindrotheca_fusiformis.AAC.7